MLIRILFDLVGFDLADVVGLGCFVLGKYFMEEIFWFASDAFYFDNFVGLVRAGIYLSKSSFGYLVSDDIFNAIDGDGCPGFDCYSLLSEIFAFFEQLSYFLLHVLVFN